MEPANVAAMATSFELVDVREPHEWEAGRIEGSKHIPMKDIPERSDEISKDKTVITICRIGQRSAMVATFLQAQGFTVENLDGGLKAWVAEGLPLTQDAGEGHLIK